MGAALMRCRTCQRDVPSLQRGLCAACYRRWRKENAPPNVTCEHCGRRYFDEAPKNHTLCSRECYRAWKVGRSTKNEPIPGRERPMLQPDGRVLLNCEWCGEPFRVRPYELQRTPRFCSLRCNAARKVAPRTFLECDHCGRRYPYLPNRLLLVNSRFCSRECFEEARRLHKLAREDCRGRSYQRFRDEQVAAAERCARCGATESLMLHHRVRSRERPDLLFDRDNVQVVCRSCHTRIHGREGHFAMPEATT